MSDTQTIEKTEVKPKNPTKLLPPWNVILHNSDVHSYEYVIYMLKELFGYEDEKCFTIAKTVDKEGKSICFSGHKELAELKKEQIESYGPDPTIKACKGSLYATLEQAV